jgi:hypothetical protein
MRPLMTFQMAGFSGARPGKAKTAAADGGML